ncbi:hypothetical protein ACO2Q0_05205 [Phenylobacterium sp. VNQ135]|uniref:hypothetical protein n=1 Tax=Phenylobacterium sp. VNQ135 TaxID=3400922 RepID=UPI003BFF83EA
MPTFRLYKMTIEGKIAVGDWLEAKDVADAKAKAMALCAGQPFQCELWQGAERLDSFSCDASSDAGCCG